jgi:hypothetical protein
VTFVVTLGSTSATADDLHGALAVAAELVAEDVRVAGNFPGRARRGLVITSRRRV